MPSPKSKPTFAERLDHDRGISPELYECYILRRALHFPLRWIYPLVSPFLHHYLESDRECIRHTASLRSLRKLHSELDEFSYHPDNRGLFRRILKQRLSTHRFYQLLRSLSQEEKADS